MKLWKTYFCFMSILCLVFVCKVFQKPELKRALAVAFDMITLVAFYGFCFNRKIGVIRFWKAGFFAALFYEVLLSSIKFSANISAYGWSVYIIAQSITIPLIVPIYIAMYRYAFKRNDIWGEEPAKQSARRRT